MSNDVELSVSFPLDSDGFKDSLRRRYYEHTHGAPGSEAFQSALGVLKAKARPLGTAKVIVEIQPEGSGSRVTMVEDPGDKLTRFVFNPLTHALVRGRNVESLRRLQELAERPG